MKFLSVINTKAKKCGIFVYGERYTNLFNHKAPTNKSTKLNKPNHILSKDHNSVESAISYLKNDKKIKQVTLLPESLEFDLSTLSISKESISEQLKIKDIVSLPSGKPAPPKAVEPQTFRQIKQNKMMFENKLNKLRQQVIKRDPFKYLIGYQFDVKNYVQGSQVFVLQLNYHARWLIFLTREAAEKYVDNITKNPEEYRIKQFPNITEAEGFIIKSLPYTFYYGPNESKLRVMNRIGEDDVVLKSNAKQNLLAVEMGGHVTAKSPTAALSEEELQLYAMEVALNQILAEMKASEMHKRRVILTNNKTISEIFFSPMSQSWNSNILITKFRSIDLFNRIGETIQEIKRVYQTRGLHFRVYYCAEVSSLLAKEDLKGAQIEEFTPVFQNDKLLSSLQLKEYCTGNSGKIETIYTDGSYYDSFKTGGIGIYYSESKNHIKKRVRCLNSSEAELIAVSYAVDTILNEIVQYTSSSDAGSRKRGFPKYLIASDDMTLVVKLQRLHTPFKSIPGTGQFIDEYAELSRKIELIKLFYLVNYEVFNHKFDIFWVKGHKNIRGNSIADKLSGQSALEQSAEPPIAYSRLELGQVVRQLAH